MILVIRYDSDGNNDEDDDHRFEAAEGSQNDPEGVTVTILP